MFELYLLETCPYCRKVIDFMNENKIEFLKHDVSEPENYDALQKIGGKSQVPFLYNKKTGLKLYESDEIIEFLKNRV